MGHTIGWLAQSAGCTTDTIRFYEKSGLLPNPPRTASGYRIYGEKHLVRLKFVLQCRDLGFTIENIECLLGKIDKGDCAHDTLHRMVQKAASEVECRIGELGTLLGKLQTLARALGDHPAGGECPLDMECPYPGQCGKERFLLCVQDAAGRKGSEKPVTTAVGKNRRRRGGKK